MSYRSWKYEDLMRLEQLEKEIFTIAPWNRQALADSFLSEHFCGILLEENEVITAYGGFTWMFDEGEIQLIATAEMYRRCGRGQEILSGLLQEAKNRGVKKLFLEVRVSNAQAQMLYLKNGFVGVYTRSRYYPNGEDAIIMMKELD